MKAQGTVHKYGDNVDTDVIIPARYLNTSSHKELAAHCMEDIDINFTIIVNDIEHLIDYSHIIRTSRFKDIPFVK